MHRFFEFSDVVFFIVQTLIPLIPSFLIVFRIFPIANEFGVIVIHAEQIIADHGENAGVHICGFHRFWREAGQAESRRIRFLRGVELGLIGKTLILRNDIFALGIHLIQREGGGDITEFVGVHLLHIGFAGARRKNHQCAGFGHFHQLFDLIICDLRIQVIHDPLKISLGRAGLNIGSGIGIIETFVRNISVLEFAFRAERLVYVLLCKIEHLDAADVLYTVNIDVYFLVDFLCKFLIPPIKFGV